MLSLVRRGGRSMETPPTVRHRTGITLLLFFAFLCLALAAFQTAQACFVLASSARTPGTLTQTCDHLEPPLYSCTGEYISYTVQNESYLRGVGFGLGTPHPQGSVTVLYD